MKRALIIFLGLLPFAVVVWGLAGAAHSEQSAIPARYCKFIQTDLMVVTHPDIFKWRWSKKKAVEPTETPPPKVEPPEEKPTIPVRKEVNGTRKPLPIKTIYFDYDKSVLKPDAKAAIQKNVQFLKEHPNADVVIEGHCDERGTNEYNMALGERRAETVKNYMIDLGIDVSRIKTKSCGEEIPAVPGHSEAAWSKNRRAELFYYEQ